MRTCGLIARTAFPARSAASRQSVAGLLFPLYAPQVAPCPRYAFSVQGPGGDVWGSLRRSTPTTVGLPAYRFVSFCQSRIQAFSGYLLVYQRPLHSGGVPMPERALSRITRSPWAPAELTMRSITARA